MSFKLTVDGVTHTIDIVRRRPHLVVRIDGREHEIDALAIFLRDRSSGPAVFRDHEPLTTLDDIHRLLVPRTLF